MAFISVEGPSQAGTSRGVSAMNQNGPSATWLRSIDRAAYRKTATMLGPSANAATIGKATECVKERGPSARALERRRSRKPNGSRTVISVHPLTRTDVSAKELRTYQPGSSARRAEGATSMSAAGAGDHGFIRARAERVARSQQQLGERFIRASAERTEGCWCRCRARADRELGRSIRVTMTRRERAEREIVTTAPDHPRTRVRPTACHDGSSATRFIHACVAERTTHEASGRTVVGSSALARKRRSGARAERRRDPVHPRTHGHDDPSVPADIRQYGPSAHARRLLILQARPERLRSIRASAGTT